MPIALVLMLPATRHWLLRRTTAHFEARVYRGTGMIQGEFTVVRENDEDVTKDDDKSQPRIKDERKVIDVE